MSSASTEKKIIKSIAEHYISDGMRKLTIQEVSEMVGISRQAFNRFYKHLKPYVLGQKPIENLIDNVDDNLLLLAKSQERIRQLSLEVERLERDYSEYKKDVENEYITTLMVNDTVLHETNEIRKTLEKQTLHNESLVNQVQALQHELTVEKARAYSNDSNDFRNEHSDLILLSPNLKPVFSNYISSNDIYAFEVEKDAALNKMINKIVKFSTVGEPRITLFIERYICSFQKFVEKNCYISGDPVIVVNLPLFTRPEMKIFMNKIPENLKVGIVVPFCESESIVKSQRVFNFRHVPDIEFDSADKLTLPTIKDGYDSVVMYKVRQGD